MKYIIIELILILSLSALMILMFNIDVIIRYAKGEGLMDNIFSSKVYDWCKWIAIVALPAISTFIVVISKIWGWADLGSMIAQTITAVAVLLGALLGISHIQYKKGSEDADS